MRVHFIAIGGSAMHNLALALKFNGDQVSGSDDQIFDPSRSRLEKAGLLPEKEGWFPERINTGLDAVILGMHAKPDNPELLRAKELGVKIYSYPEFLYERTKDKTRVVIAGSHGKTTITAMILHVMNYHGVEVDYMVGAQLQGFDRMVHLTKENEFVVLEGDEYLSSPIDRRPKFLWYKANIALMSGIAWDHINVFPTFENYLEQFSLFIEAIVKGGSITYNLEDPNVVKLVEGTQNAIKKFGYQTPESNINNGITYLETAEGPIPLEVFGNHNLQNLAGAKWICQQMGIDQADFYDAIASFKGAGKRLEKIAGSTDRTLFKDYAHSPSKVLATTKSVKSQFVNRRLIACLELHTYSSLNAVFLRQYLGTLQAADEAIVFYSPKAIEIKRLDPISEEQIREAFANPGINIFTDPKQLSDYLFAGDYSNSVLLFMSSGNYGGLDLKKLGELFGTDIKPQTA